MAYNFIPSKEDVSSEDKSEGSHLLADESQDGSSEEYGYQDSVSSENKPSFYRPHDKQTQRYAWIFAAINFCLLIPSVLLLAYSASSLKKPNSNILNERLRHDSVYSPMFDRLEIPLSITQVNGSFLDSDPPSVWRADPSPEVDAAWARIANVGMSAMTREDIEKVGKDPEISAKRPESVGLGSEAYMANIDVFHLIHCLNEIRKDVHFDYYFSERWPDGKPNEWRRKHTGHCFHLILQHLMCHADVDAITYQWTDSQYNAYPDFSVYRQCRDFETLLKWQEENTVDPVLVHNLRAPPDVPRVQMSQEFRAAFEIPDDFDSRRPAPTP